MSTGDNSPEPSKSWWRKFKPKRWKDLGPEGRKSKLERSQIWSARTQLLTTLVTVAAVLVALWVATQGQDTVNNNSQTALRQSEDNQLSTAVTALGSSDTAERIAGLLLLTQNVSGRFRLAAETGEPPTDLHFEYATALQILSGYLRSHGEAFLISTSTGPVARQFGLGYGAPPARTLGVMPIDIYYAADQLRLLLHLRREVLALGGVVPELDLSNDELYGQNWHGVNFDWLRAHMSGIDLRGADLEDSQWGEHSDLSHAYLQCADLEGANFRGADLAHADLRGADVQGADFRGAYIRKAQLTQLYGNAKWPSWRHSNIALPASRWRQNVCLLNSQLWDYQPTSLPSPRPSSSATPRSQPTT